jgi:hypothetical protein
MIDIHGDFGPATVEEVADMKLKMQTFIFPNTVETDSQELAFNLAVELQIEHEKTIASKADITGIPEGTLGFQIGKFSMTFQKGAFSGMLTRSNICPSAYGLLLKEGLLYRGVG